MVYKNLELAAKYHGSVKGFKIFIKNLDQNKCICFYAQLEDDISTINDQDLINIFYGYVHDALWGHLLTFPGFCQFSGINGYSKKYKTIYKQARKAYHMLINLGIQDLNQFYKDLSEDFGYNSRILNVFD